MLRSLSAGVLAFALSACGDGSDADSGDVETETVTVAPAASPLETAFDACGPQLVDGMASFGDDAPALEEVLSVHDEGSSLIVTTPQPSGEITSSIAFLAASCVLEETGAPATVLANMQSTTAFAGTQTAAAWDDIEVVWSYAAGVGNAGFNATFALVG